MVSPNSRYIEEQQEQQQVDKRQWKSSQALSLKIKLQLYLAVGDKVKWLPENTSIDPEWPYKPNASCRFQV